MPEMSLADAIQLGYQHPTAGRFADAELVAQQILAVFPNQPRALHYLAIAQHQQGRVEEAIPKYVQAIALDAVDAEPCCNLAEAYRSIHKYEDAIAAARQVDRAGPCSSRRSATRIFGVALNYVGKDEEADASSSGQGLRDQLVWQQAEHLQRSASRRSSRGQAGDEALQCYQRFLLQIQANAPGTLNNWLRRRFQEMNRHEEAVEAYRRVLSKLESECQRDLQQSLQRPPRTGAK